MAPSSWPTWASPAWWTGSAVQASGLGTVPYMGPELLVDAPTASTATDGALRSGVAVAASGACPRLCLTPLCPAVFAIGGLLHEMTNNCQPLLGLPDVGAMRAFILVRLAAGGAAAAAAAACTAWPGWPPVRHLPAQHGNSINAWFVAGREREDLLPQERGTLCGGRHRGLQALHPC